MTSRKLIWLVLLIPVFMGIAIPGCSDKTFTSTSTEVSQSAQPTAFLPLEQGLRVSYVLLEPETQHYDIEVTRPVTVAGYPGFTIRKTDRNTGEIEIFYRYVKDNAIFESGSTSYPGERILEAPFVVGNTWDRNDTSTTEITVFDDYNFDNEDQNDANDNDLPGDVHKDRPDGAYSMMRIVGLETVEALNGTSYGNCLKVAWQTDESTYNYYWYAAGIGLVKFEQNVNSMSQIDNEIVGLMTDFQTVEY